LIRIIKIPLGICLLNLVMAILFSYAIEAGMGSTSTGFAENFANSFDMLGAVSAVGGLADLIIASFLLGYRKKTIGAGFLLSAIVLLLLTFFLNNFYS